VVFFSVLSSPGAVKPAGERKLADSMVIENSLADQPLKYFRCERRYNFSVGRSAKPLLCSAKYAGLFLGLAGKGEERKSAIDGTMKLAAVLVQLGYFSILIRPTADFVFFFEMLIFQK
jgi:hypothetical protein